MHVSGVTVTILADNRAAYGLEAEHGFACWVRTASRTILLDTGRGEAMPRNAESLGIDIGTADTIVLSHGHYDHTGNVPYALARAKQADLFLHPEAVGERYSFHNEAKPIGMPAASQAAVYGLSESRCRWVEVAQELDAGVWLSGTVPRVTRFEDTGGPFYLDAAGLRADSILDDLSLAVKTRAGLVVCLGCCHAGIVNTLRHLTRVTGEPRVLAVIGGLHLLHAGTERLERTTEALAAYTIPYVYPCHCTGDDAVAWLTQRLGSKVQPGYAGMKIGF